MRFSRQVSQAERTHRSCDRNYRRGNDHVAWSPRAGDCTYAASRGTAMIRSTTIAPPNSLVLVEDPSGGEVPESMGSSVTASTDSCIAVGCRSESDGKSEVVLGPSAEMDPGTSPVLDQELSTPSRKVVVRTVLGDTVLESPVSTEKTRIRVWVNDQKEPDRILIGTS